MKIDLDSGINIQIGGELGKYNSLPISVLSKVALSLQKLVKTIAREDLPSEDMINMENFEIELVDFRKGSAVPKFAFSPRVENKIGKWKVHRNTVGEKFEKIIEVSNSGNYYELFELYPEPKKRNLIVEDLYSFVHEFGNTPVNFVDFDENSNKITPIYSLNKFKPAVKKQLLGKIVETKEIESDSNEAVGKIRIITKGNSVTRKIINLYTDSKYSLEYAPNVIVTTERNYILKHPLRCLFEKEDDEYFVIHSEMLEIIGTGLTEDEAELSFNQEFDYLYKRLNSLDDKQLTKHNILLKNILNHLVEKIES